jgi:4-hydroxy-tetrahydrodipicolinate reductase
MSKKIVISGAAGRMGQTLTALIAAGHHLELVGAIDRHNAGDCADLIAAGDVIVDFSSVAGLQNLLEHDLSGKALVVGTTGLTPDVLESLDRASAQTAVLVAANFSIGVNLLLGLVEAAARVLSPEAYDVEIVEAHHSRKVDAPSGTALAFGLAVAKARDAELDSLRQDGRSGQVGARAEGEIGFHALRGGEIVGEHRVHFIGAHERIELAHSAQDRGLFAEGALRAAAWIAGKPAGRYSMKDVLGLEGR